MLEIIAFNISSALAAEAAGADRLELCDNACVGGTTPSYGFMKYCIEHISIPSFPMIRPRGGNFIYSNSEKEIMLVDISLCKALGCKGIVCGALLEDGSIDIEFLEAVMYAANGMEVTFHRAFDRCIDPYKALEILINAGVNRILTSGQAPTALAGHELIKELIEISSGKIIIMPGSGIRAENISLIKRYTNAEEYHSSAAMKHNQSAPDNTLPGSNISYDFIDETEIRLMKKFLIV